MQVRAEQFRFFAEALKSAKLKVYVPHFVQEAQVTPAAQLVIPCPCDWAAGAHRWSSMMPWAATQAG